LEKETAERGRAGHHRQGAAAKAPEQQPKADIGHGSLCPIILKTYGQRSGVARNLYGYV
jgi:hypothetical protein